jgi:hypothetical protein
MLSRKRDGSETHDGSSELGSLLPDLAQVRHDRG